MTDIPTGWETATLGELADFVMGQAPPGSETNFDGVGTPFVKAGEFATDRPLIREWTTRPLKLARDTDVLICVVGATSGKINLGAECAIGRSVAAIRPTEALRQQYIYDFLKTKVDELRQGATGSAQGVISREMLSRIEIPLAPLAEQRRIVAKLDSLTGATARAYDELEHIPALIARYKQAILSGAFDGELTRVWRAEHRIDKDPPVVRLEDVAKDLSYGSSAKSSKQGEVPVLRMGNIQSGALDWEDLVYTSDPAEINKYLLTSGDVLFNRTNSPELVGKTAVYHGERKAIFAGYLIRVQCTSNLSPDYLCFCLNSPQGRDYCWRVKTDGVSQSNVNAKKLAAFSFRLPSIDEQREIVQRIETAFHWLDRVAAEHKQAVRLLPRLDQAVLAKAFRGDLVPQRPDDEPASVLLERVRAARAEAPTRGRKLRLRGTAEIEFTGTGSLTVAQKEQDMKTRADVSPNYLSDIMKKSGGQIKADALWRASEMSIDEFYKQLRNEITMGFVREGANKELLELADAA